ncbi:hypothetical protein BOTBODRAFT_398317 [Botryobasidium botryosum FD-172 SS1]|uniref:Uncharacterized protein n=1 Tax=Botryobasidium botryosum (strain FD-172 SS1) TaxID=930990 RepID=A0A067MBT1_BOTB1|nr:hypothetical protein BOTBODRAFT_398317 [Botryobasidium botryosum FD-172 SS1]
MVTQLLSTIILTSAGHSPMSFFFIVFWRMRKKLKGTCQGSQLLFKNYSDEQTKSLATLF